MLMKKSTLKILIKLTVWIIFIVIYSQSSETPSKPTPIESSPPQIEKPIDETTLYKVIRVIDGDTIEIEGGQKIRYIGIDTSEITTPIECYGIEASNRNKELVDGKFVKLLKDVSETDRYGRLLRYVYIDDTFVNELLVREGFANASSYPPDIKYQEQLTEAEKTARANNLGLWGKCIE
ncbi:MAG: micrococcal nuclease [Patescibacteria group bacterium]|nr:micrococcal nuclease [Patescibacteria group bacterium]